MVAMVIFAFLFMNVLLLTVGIMSYKLMGKMTVAPTLIYSVIANGVLFVVLCFANLIF